MRSHDPLAKLAKFLPEYPEIKVKITVDYTLADIIAQRFDADMHRRAGSEGHNRSPYRAGHAYGGGLRAVLFREAVRVGRYAKLPE